MWCHLVFWIYTWTRKAVEWSRCRVGFPWVERAEEDAHKQWALVFIEWTRNVFMFNINVHIVLILIQFFRLPHVHPHIKHDHINWALRCQCELCTQSSSLFCKCNAAFRFNMVQCASDNACFCSDNFTLIVIYLAHCLCPPHPQKIFTLAFRFEASHIKCTPAHTFCRHSQSEMKHFKYSEKVLVSRLGWVR